MISQRMKYFHIMLSFFNLKFRFFSKVNLSKLYSKENASHFLKFISSIRFFMFYWKRMVLVVFCRSPA